MRSLLALTCAVLLGVPAALAQPAPGAPPSVADGVDAFAGSWKGDGLSLTFRRTGESYTGTAVAAGHEYPLQAEMHDGVMTGIYSDERALRIFQAFVDGEFLQLASDGERRVLRQSGHAVMPAPLPASIARTSNGYPVIDVDDQDLSSCR